MLRHHPDSVGLTLDPNGWVEIPRLLAALAGHGRPISRELLDLVVDTNDKRRYEVCTRADGGEWIRASQGHSRSIAVDLDLPPATPPATLYHGTRAAAVASIVEHGLRPGQRHHVHLSADEDTAWTVGRRRRTTAVVLRVDAAAMAAAGHVFHRSANGVWLTAEVPATFVTLDGRIRPASA